MPARAYWTGHLRLSLVSIGIELYTATSSSSQISLNQIHKPSGKRIRYQKVAPGVGPVDVKDIVKGFEVSKDNYVLLSPEELDQIKLESKEVIDLVQFVEQCEIDPRYFEKPYYVLPQEGDVAAEGFAVIREALRDSKKVGLGQMTSRGRDHLVAIRPCGDGLLLEILRYADEVKESDKVFEEVPDIKIDKDMKSLAKELIERKSAAFDPEVFESHYADALRDLIEEKRKKGKISSASDDELEGETEDNVIDLMQALKESVARDKARKSKSKSKTKTGKKSKSGRKTG